MLLLLIQHRERVVSKDELLDAVWGLNVSEGVIGFQINQLRKALNDNAAQPQYIQTIAKRGFKFIAEVKELKDGQPQPLNGNNRSPAAAIDQQKEVAPEPGPDAVEEFERSAGRDRNARRKLLMMACVAILLAGCAVTALYWWRKGEESQNITEINSPFDDAELRRVVKESQFFETLTIYGDPKSFDRSQLLKYWLPAEQGGKEITQVEAAIERLLSKGLHYGSESRAEMFEFRYVRILEPGDHAVVGTTERWYIPTYDSNDNRVLDRNVYLGPNLMDYKLRKVNGSWLIEETTVPRPRKE